MLLQIAKEELVRVLDMELINRINEVGVDMNRCLEHPHLAAALQVLERCLLLLLV